MSPSEVQYAAPTAATTADGKPTAALAVLTSLFFMWGFLTCLNDILVPHLKSIFDLSYTKVMLVQFAFFSAYLIFSVPWSKVVDKIGYHRTMVFGLVTAAVGAAMFVPAASVPSFALFLAALIVLAAGITALQVAANPYVLILGRPETASSRLNLTQAFNSLGTTIAPRLGGLLILSAVPLTLTQLHALTPAARDAYRLEEAASVKLPYLIIALTLLLLAIAIAKFPFPEIPHIERHLADDVEGSLWKHRNLVLGAVGIFAYVGAEVSVGSFLVNYISLPSIGAMTTKSAAGFVSLFWAGSMIGRFIGAAALQRIKTGILLAACTVCSALLITISMLTSGAVAMWSILAVGLFNSIMFPSIFSLGVAGLGHLTGAGSGVMNMAIVGGAIIPVLQGVIADHIGIQHAFFMPVLCYLYILYYALRGSRPQTA